VPGLILVVHDAKAELQRIGELLTAVGRPFITASSVDGALEALRAQSVSVLLLAPGLESARGHVVLEELPRISRGTAVVLLGESAPGFQHPVAPMPPGEDFVEQVLAPERQALLAAAARALETARGAAQAERGRVEGIAQHLNDLELKLAMREADNARLSRELDAAKTARSRVEARVSTLQGEVAKLGALEKTLSTERAEATRVRQAVSADEERIGALTHERDALEQQLRERTEEKAALEERIADLTRERDALKPLEARVEALTQERDALQPLEARVDALTLERDALKPLEAQVEALTQERDALQPLEARIEALTRERDALRPLQARVAELTRERDTLKPLEARVEALTQERDALQPLEARVAQLSRERDALQPLSARVRELERAVAAERARAEAAEAQARQAVVRIQELEDGAVLRLEAAQAPALIVPPTGNVGLTELARLVAELGEARAGVRLDLTVVGGMRRLWLSRGALVAASSTLAGETLAMRAHRDGLLDARQAAQLDALRDASVSRQLEELLRRGMIRSSEVDALLQRYVEGLALEALSEADSTYVLAEEAPGAQVPQASSLRALPALVVLALRRGLPPQAHLALVGGPLAVPRGRAAPFDAETLGFSARERTMLERVDGVASVEMLAADSELGNERAWQALAIAKVLGLVELQAFERPRPDDGTRLLEEKYAQIQNADYFAILELPRTADAAAVRRAQLVLTELYDPLKFAAHADPAVLQRAQIVHQHVKDAARALQDDRRRAQYARHLLQ
jgi:hypothetical protein